MPNAVIRLLDSQAQMSKETILRGLAEIPFVRHQYRWLVSEVATLPLAAAKTMLAGYCGMRRMSQKREVRLSEACALVSTLTPAEIANLPERISAPAPMPLTQLKSKSGILPPVTTTKTQCR